MTDFKIVFSCFCSYIFDQFGAEWPVSDSTSFRPSYFVIKKLYKKINKIIDSKKEAKIQGRINSYWK